MCILIFVSTALADHGKQGQNFGGYNMHALIRSEVSMCATVTGPIFPAVQCQGACAELLEHVEAEGVAKIVWNPSSKKRPLRPN
jgi:hypothetical protein